MGIPKNDLLSRLLHAAALRQRVIADNLANSETPGFTRKIVHFEDLLTKALESGSGKTDRIQPFIEEDRITPADSSGNNVEMELEMNSMRENQILFDTYSAMLQSRFSMLRASIDGGR